MEFVRIENRDRWYTEIPQLVPNSYKWLQFWREEKRKCIEGIWEKDFEGYRYMSGPLYFYIHYCTIIDFNKKRKVNEEIRPRLRDIEWERSYGFLVARGFSGFEDDPEYSCNHDIPKWHRDEVELADLHVSCFKKDGTLKEYQDPLTYTRRIHKGNYGLPVYENETLNFMEFGSRGGGKSYFWGLAAIKHSLVFDGKRYYDRKSSRSDNFIAAGQASKSGETGSKIVDSLSSLSFSPALGAFKEEGEEGHKPHPFHKRFQGDMMPGKKPFQHTYKIKTETGDWKTFKGSKLAHGVITVDNPQTSAGSRNDITLVEEVGLIPNVKTFHGSNEATQARNGIRFGTSIYIGTAGNAEKIMEAKEMFLNPDEYRIVSYPDTYGMTGDPIGFFLPAYYTYEKYKDEHGNTDIEAAKKHALREREKKKGNESAYTEQIMNWPIHPDEMWVTDSAKVFPTMESKEKQNELHGKKIGTGVDLFYDTKGKISYKPNNKQPVPWPFKSHYNAEGTVYIYDFPIRINTPYTDKDGNRKFRKTIPRDAYIFGCDPYATDKEKDARNSLGAVYVILNPKYWDQSTTKHILVASYIGRPSGGRKVFYQNLEMMLEFYGNPVRGLWYENDRGDTVKAYFEKKNKTELLAIDGINQKITGRPTIYGFNTGNQHKKLDRIDSMSDFLREISNIRGEKLMNIYRIPDQYLHAEIQAFSINSKRNFDRIMAFVGCVVGARNIYNEQVSKLQNKNTPHLSFFTKKLNESNKTKTKRRREKRRRLRSRQRTF